MRRRVHVPVVMPGRLVLGEAESHHLRDVLRVQASADIEVFDTAGRSAIAVILQSDAAGVIVNVGPVRLPDRAFPLTIAAAVPKGDRADWMIEKLSEVGVTHFIPLETARSVVLPAGRGKSDRWQRIAVEAAKQCRRDGVMTIAPLTKVTHALRTGDGKFIASTGPHTVPLLGQSIDQAWTIFIGPEGGWTDEELDEFAHSGGTAVSLTPTILRIETAAVAAATLVMCGLHRVQQSGV